jgi:hypothetical protein
MVYWWCCGETTSEEKKRKDDSPKKVEEFIDTCPNLDPIDAENLRKEDDFGKCGERKKS